MSLILGPVLNLKVIFYIILFIQKETRDLWFWIELKFQKLFKLNLTSLVSPKVAIKCLFIFE
jgi:hypothetical protein